MTALSLLENPTKANLIAALWSDYLLFCQYFFPIVTGNPFVLSRPVGRESHYITIARELTEVFELNTRRLYIGIPPGYGKSKKLCMWIAWAMSRYPDSEFLYISYSFELATEHTEFIRSIMQCREYRELFNIKIKQDRKAKDHFKTEQGGCVKAFGTAGSITGFNAGKPFLKRFSGAVVIDDPHNAGDVLSDAKRESVINKYVSSICQRPRGENIPIVMIAQRTHEADLVNYVLSGHDAMPWKSVILKALDENGHPLHPEYHSLEYLRNLQEKQPYIFAAQHQQDPTPAGGALFKKDWFVILDREPNVFSTFITVDAAETADKFNDATVFSFWGVYNLETAGQEIPQLGLHWIDCREIWIEPFDLMREFELFYGDCLRYPIKPLSALVEKKSMGTYLCSALESFRGLTLKEILRTGNDGSKGDRFVEMQGCISSKLVSFTNGRPHVSNCLEHMSKIVPNCTHRRDDIADTAYDAIRGVYLAPIPSLIQSIQAKNRQKAKLASHFAATSHHDQLRRDLWR